MLTSSSDPTSDSSDSAQRNASTSSASTLLALIPSILSCKNWVLYNFFLLSSDDVFEASTPVATTTSTTLTTTTTTTSKSAGRSMKNRCDSTSTSSHSGKSSYPLLFSFSDIVWGKKIGKHVINIFLFISLYLTPHIIVKIQIYVLHFIISMFFISTTFHIKHVFLKNNLLDFN